MRDQTHMDASTQRERRMSEAAGHAKGIAEFERAIEDLAAQCVDFVQRGNAADCEGAAPSAFLGYLGASSEVFPGVAVREVRDSLRHGLDALLGDRHHELQDISALLLGRASSAALVKGLNAGLPAHVLVHGIFELCGVGPLAYDALTTALKGALSEHERVRSAMLGHLSKCVGDINRNPGKLVYEQEREPFDRYVREWRESPSIVDLWRGHPADQFLPIFDRLDFVDAVLDAVPDQTLPVLDRLRFPQPLNSILSIDSIRHDGDKIIELIQLAPRSFDRGGKWNGSLLALLLLKEADNHCRNLWRAVHRDGTDLEEVRDRLHSWIAQLAAIVLGRDDGRFLATHWLRMKSMDERLERRSGGRGGAFLPQLEMIGWIGDGLVDAGLRGQDISNAPRRSRGNVKGGLLRPGDEAGDLDALALTAMLDQLSENAKLDRQVLLSGLDVLLGSRNLGFEVEATLDVGLVGFVDLRIGYLLATEDGPDRWKRSWELLTEQRRDVQHWRHTKDSSALAPSLFLVRAGLAALDWLCSESSVRGEVVETLWRTMFDAVRECWLTISVAHLADAIERDIGRLFSRHPTVFGASAAKPDSNRVYSQLLADHLGTLGGDDVLMARCCELVSRNLQDQTHLHHALRCNSSRGHAVLKQFVHWQQLERRVKRQPQHLYNAVQEVLAEME